MNKKPVFSIIIPAKNINSYLIESINSILESSFKDFEIIIILDKKNNNIFPKTKIISSKLEGPAEKRDLGAKKAKGEYLAFIDDDVFVSKDWLRNGLFEFKNINVAAVCGPGVTPKNDSILQKVSGCISSSLIGGGPYTYRFIPSKKRQVDDYPSMNFLIRKNAFLKINGFDTNYWPGEDTKLCLDIVNKLKMKIIYSPDVLVFHHRRAILKEHLIQNGRYGLHRGFFAKKLPETSFRLSYFIPSVFTLGLLIGPFTFFLNFQLFYFYLICILFYLLLILSESIKIFLREKNSLISILFIPAIILTHIWYGLRFIQGFLFTKKLIQ